MNANQRPDAATLLALAKAGATIDIVTMTRVTRIDRKVVERFEKVNRPVLKDSSNGRLLMSSGRKYVDCSYCGLRVTDAAGSRDYTLMVIA